MSVCRCPRIDGYVIIRQSCPHHPEAAARRAARAAEPAPTPEPEELDPDVVEMECQWAEYRKDYGLSAGHMGTAKKAFVAGWQAARGVLDAGGPLR